MEKYKQNRKKLIIILLSIDMVVVLFLSLFINKEIGFSTRLSNNFFIVSMVFLVVGVVFELQSWSLHKKIVKKSEGEISIDELRQTRFDDKTISKVRMHDNLKFRKELYKVLNKIFMIIGVIDFLASLFMLIFI